MSSCDRAELMAVHTLEYDTFSVKGHDTILHFKTAETDFLRMHLRSTVSVMNMVFT